MIWPRLFPSLSHLLLLFLSLQPHCSPAPVPCSLFLVHQVMPAQGLCLKFPLPCSLILDTLPKYPLSQHPCHQPLTSSPPVLLLIHSSFLASDPLTNHTLYSHPPCLLAHPLRNSGHSLLATGASQAHRDTPHYCSTNVLNDSRWQELNKYLLNR